MDYDAFMQSVASDDAPAMELPGILQALWFCAKGDWEASHNIAQDIHHPDGSWVHAHLHRVEGDLGNAGYWYNLANQAVCRDDLDAEREALIKHFLAQQDLT